jgi:hypothetical protein
VLVWPALVAALTMCTSEADKPSPCETADDCWSAPEAKELDRCAPAEAACLGGSCRLACAQTCEVVDPQVNPCHDPKLICNQAKNGAIDLPFCAGSPIACTSADDCPVGLPEGAADDATQWDCDAGVCRFPGFVYAWE